MQRKWCSNYRGLNDLVSNSQGLNDLVSNDQGSNDLVSNSQGSNDQGSVAEQPCTGRIQRKINWDSHNGERSRSSRSLQSKMQVADASQVW